MTQYLDFDLLIERASGKYKARVRNSAAGQAAVEFSLPDSAREPENFLPKAGRPRRGTRYFERYLLRELGGPLVRAMDEVESIFASEVRSGFFAMLRIWHNSRATKPIWKRLDLALITSIELFQLVENLNQSPCNVGEVIDLPDFTRAQVADFNAHHSFPLNTDYLSRLMTLLRGHPIVRG